MTTATITLDEPLTWHEEDGGIVGLSWPGHIPIEDATALTWWWLIDMGETWTIRRGHPRHTWLRKVPWLDSMRFDIVGPGCGATPITYVEWASSWDSIRCHHWPACHEPACVGQPAGKVADAPPGVKYVYLCREHGEAFDRRWNAAVAARRAAEHAPEDPWHVDCTQGCEKGDQK